MNRKTPTAKQVRAVDHLARVPSWLRNGHLWLFACLLLTTPWVFRGAGDALRERDNQIRQWLPDGFEETRRYDWFVKHFQSEEFTLISWPGAELSDPRLDQLVSRLSRYSQSDDVPNRASESLWFRSVRSGAQFLDQLQEEPFLLDERSARERLQGALISRDGRTTGLIALLSPTGQADRHAAVETIYREAELIGLSREQIKLGGPTIDSVALDQESERSRYLLSTLSLLLGGVAAWRCLRNWKLVAIVLLTAIYCGAATLAWTQVFGDKLNLVMVTMPTLVYVLTISGAIHITHYFASAWKQHGGRAAAREALRAGWLPCVLTAITTAIGLGSLMVSHVEPVRLFGFYSSLGVLTGLPVILFFLPATLSLFLRDRDMGESEGRRRRGRADRVDAGEARVERFGRWVIRRRGVLSAVGLTVMALSVLGLSRLTTSVKLTSFFSSESRVISDYRWLEQNLAPLVPVEVVLRVPIAEESKLLDRLQLTRAVHDALAEMPEVEGVVSAATFAPEVPSGGGIRQVAKRAVLNKKLASNRGHLESLGYLQAEPGFELWRVSARIEALNDIDYGQFINQLQSTVDPVLAEAVKDQPAFADTEAVYTGVIPLIYKAQRVLLEDLTTSFVTAFAIIGVVMLMLMRGVGAGLVSMLPNTFPALVVFGLMGWSGWACDIGSMITASVALGIAVDDTIHFMSWFRRGLASGLDRHGAVLLAFRRCGAAMLQTTLICGLGMLGFAFSEFAPTARFAMLMSSLLVAALVGDLLFLPALLAGPLGRFYERHAAPAPKTPVSEEAPYELPSGGTAVA